MTIPTTPFENEIPTLVVGMGGLGGDIVERVYEHLHHRGGLSDHVAWHVLDTNSLDLGQLKYLGARDDHYTQLGKGVATHIVGMYRHLYPASRDWFFFGPEIDRKSTLEGAGQIRAVSRLTFMNEMLRGDGELGIDAAVARLQGIKARMKDIQRKVRVIVVTSLAGGTGAGSFIPLALYLRHAIADSTGLPPASVMVRGFFILPDVFVGNGVVPANQHGRMRANAVACIKEIEAIREHAMNRSDVPVLLEYWKGVDAQPAIMPFDYAYLFDYHTEGGQTLGSYDQYKAQIAEAIRVALFSPLGIDGLSVEDNFIADIAKGNGLNTYGGAAVSELRFPVERVVDYLVARWSSQELDDVWLRPDRHYLAVLQDFEADEQRGIVGTEPVRGKVFCDYVDLQAESDDAPPIFRRLRSQTHEVDAEGVPLKGQARADAWLNALTAWLEARAEPDKALEKGPSEGKLSDREAAVSVVRSFEERLARRKRAVVGRDWRSESTALAAQATVQDADEGVLRRGEGPQRMLYWLFDDEGSVHPLAVRYFLYGAQATLERALLALDAEVGKLREVIDKYDSRWDLPATKDRVETAQDRVKRALDQPLLQRVLRNDLKSFMTSYVSGSRKQARDLQTYLKERLKLEVLRRVKAFVDDFVEEWEALFDGLRLRRDRLANEANRLELEHEHSSQANPMVQFAFADARAKRALWDDFRRLVGSSQASAAQTAAFEAVYGRAAGGPREREGRTGIVDAFLSGMTGVIRDAIWSRGSAAETQLGARLPSDILEALRREAELSGSDSHEHMAARIGSLSTLAVPFAQPTVDATVQRFELWGLSDDLAEVVPGRVLEVMERTKFSPAFSRHEILFYKVHAGYAARQLRRFVPAPIGDGMRFVPGPYYEAYQRHLAEYRGGLERWLPGSQEPFSVLLDKRWVDSLPDFWDANLRPLVDRALFRGVALGVLVPAGGSWAFRGETLAPYGERGSLRGLRTALGKRMDIIEAIDQQFDERFRADRERYGDEDWEHRFVKGFRGSAELDQSVLSLVADMIFTTNKGAEGMHDVREAFRSACEELRGYLRKVYPMNADRVTSRTKDLLSKIDERANWETRVAKKDLRWMDQLADALRAIKHEAADTANAG